MGRELPQLSVLIDPFRLDESTHDKQTLSSGRGTGSNGIQPKVYLETYGCQMNSYDSELIQGILTKSGYAFVRSVEQADIVLLNTCAIREHAHEKIYFRLNELKGLKRRGRIRKIGVLGCMAQSLREELTERVSTVDLVVGPDGYKKLPSLIEQSVGGHEIASDFSLSEYETYADIVPCRVSGVTAWIAIMRGCDNFCSFCVVPYTRGRERSRAVDGIVEEAKQVVAEGFKQITLLGQNVNSYHHDGTTFADLMEQVGCVPGISRIRFTSPHPKDFPQRLLQVMADSPTLCKHIHLPLQSGNDQVLMRMNRSYTRDDYRRLVDQIRQILSGVSLTTDIICGFSGETDEQFSDTLSLVREVEFDSAFIFKYSERKQTIASRKFPDDVPDSVKTARVVLLNQLQRTISKACNERDIGTVQCVLVEAPSKKRPTEWLGRTDRNKRVVFFAPEHGPGDLVDVKIIEATTNTLIGVVWPAAVGEASVIPRVTNLPSVDRQAS